MNKSGVLCNGWRVFHLVITVILLYFIRHYANTFPSIFFQSFSLLHKLLFLKLFWRALRTEERPNYENKGFNPISPGVILGSYWPAVKCILHNFLLLLRKLAEIL